MKLRHIRMKKISGFRLLYYLPTTAEQANPKGRHFKISSWNALYEPLRTSCKLLLATTRTVLGFLKHTMSFCILGRYVQTKYHENPSTD